LIWFKISQKTVVFIREINISYTFASKQPWCIQDSQREDEGSIAIEWSRRGELRDATHKIRIRSTARCNYPCGLFLPLPTRSRRSRCSRERSDASCWFSANAGCFRKAPSTVNSRLRSRQKYSLAADSELAFVKTSVTGLAGRFSYRVSFCGRSDNAGVTGLRCIHGPWTRMDLNENLLINNKQPRACSHLLFPRDIPLSFLSLSLSLSTPCVLCAAQGWRDRKDGIQTGPEHEDGCGPRRRRHLAGPLDFQLYFVKRGDQLDCDTLYQEKKFLWVNLDMTLVLGFKSGKTYRFLYDFYMIV